MISPTLQIKRQVTAINAAEATRPAISEIAEAVSQEPRHGAPRAIAFLAGAVHR